MVKKITMVEEMGCWTIVKLTLQGSGALPQTFVPGDCSVAVICSPLHKPSVQYYPSRCRQVIMIDDRGLV